MVNGLIMLAIGILLGGGIVVCLLVVPLVRKNEELKSKLGTEQFLLEDKIRTRYD